MEYNEKQMKIDRLHRMFLIQDFSTLYSWRIQLCWFRSFYKIQRITHGKFYGQRILDAFPIWS